MVVTVPQSKYFVENLTHPVRFPDAVGRMGEAFPQAVFLEVGPHPALHRPVVQCLKGIDGVDARVLGTLDRRMAGPTALRKCVAGLACCGCAARTALDARTLLTPVAEVALLLAAVSLLAFLLLYFYTRRVKAVEVLGDAL